MNNEELDMSKIRIYFSVGLMAGLYASQIASSQASIDAKVGESYIFITNDDVKFEVPKALIENAGTVKNVFQDTSSDAPVNLLEINSPTFFRVLEFLKTQTIDENLTLDEAFKLLRAGQYLDLVSIHDSALKILVKKMSWNCNELQCVLGSNLLRDELRVEIAREFARSQKKLPLYSESGYLLWNIHTQEPLWTVELLAQVYAIPSIEKQVKISLVKQLIENSYSLLAMMGIDISGILTKIEDQNFQKSRKDIIYTLLGREDDCARRDKIRELLGEEYPLLIKMLKKEYPAVTDERH